MSDRIAVATRKGLFTLKRASGAAKPRWTIDQTAFLGDNLSMILVDPRDATWYAALGHGHFGVKVHRSHDGGKTWREIATPAYPPTPENYTPPPHPMGKPAPWNIELLWSLETGGKDQPGVIWAGTIPGGLFRSTDKGDSWRMIRSLWDDPRRNMWFGGGYDYPGIHSICVDPRDSRRVTVGVSCGGVWGTTDSGETWDCRATGMFADYMPPDQKNDPNIQDPHRVVQCLAKPDCLWAQHHNGVFRTTDGAESWQVVENVPPSVFGFAVAVHPRDPNAAWFVPAIKDEKRIPVDGQVVVTRTRDGGKTFDVLRNGLPGPHAYDLTFRHALDIDESGDRLAFGSTSGSLWISENQGDSWDTVSQHLPPIHAVRFIAG